MPKIDNIFKPQNYNNYVSYVIYGFVNGTSNLERLLFDNLNYSGKKNIILMMS